MTRTIYVVGDVHQPGDGPTVFDRWLEVLAEREVGRLVVLGDLFEAWLETAASVRRHAATFDRLRALRERGWWLDFVPGNRELAGTRLLAAAGRFVVHWPQLTLVRGGRRIRIVHGDRLCRDPSYHLFAATLRSFWFQGAGRCLPDPAREAFARACRGWSQAKHAKAARRTRGASTERMSPARVRAAARGVDSLIAGHIHQQWRRRLFGVDLVLVGDWSPAGGHWIEIDSAGTLALRGGAPPFGSLGSLGHAAARRATINSPTAPSQKAP